MSVESKLELLAAVFPDESPDALQSHLKRARDDVQLATNAILSQREGEPASQQSKRSGGLANWLGIVPQKRQRTLLVKGNLSSSKIATTSKNAFDVLKPPAPVTSTSAPAALPTLSLTTSEMIRIYTNGLCTLIPNVLPNELAARLFVRLVEESVGGDKKAGCTSLQLGVRTEQELTITILTGEKNRWWLFDRQVESPHTTSFYVERPVDSAASAYDQESFAEVSVARFQFRLRTDDDV